MRHQGLFTVTAALGARAKRLHHQQATAGP